MGKGSGGTRRSTPGGVVSEMDYSSEGVALRPLTEKEKAELRANSEYSSIKFYPNGGFVAIEKSPQKHSEDEITVGRFLAKSGRQVILKNEAGFIKTRDGEIISIGNYEQRTPSKTIEQKYGEGGYDKVKTMRNAIAHAHSKKADIALIYLKNGYHKDKDVKNGIRAFMFGYTDNDGVQHNGSNYRFKQIITVSRNGKIKVYHHEDFEKKKGT